jgi:3-dehydroquinate synthase
MQSMKKVIVNLGNRSYRINVGAGLLESVGPWLKERKYSGRAVIVTDTTVGGLYAGALSRGLEAAGFTVTLFEVPPGEATKTLETATTLYDKLTEALAERSTPLLALGGGVVGDLAGFVAATYRRGMPLVQVPTTLLAQVDSSIGGKTAVDYGRLKNNIGVFYQPVMVVADTDTLKTLRKMSSPAVCRGHQDRGGARPELLPFPGNQPGKGKELHPRAIEDMISAAARAKAEVVSRDEREGGLRAVLNFGHTVGHAVETVSGFSLKHGQAVAIGMMAAAKISARMRLLRESEVLRLEHLLASAGLPTKMPDLDREEVLRVMQHDKKVQGAKVRFVLLKSLGNALVSSNVDPALVREVLVGWD